MTSWLVSISRLAVLFVAEIAMLREQMMRAISELVDSPPSPSKQALWRALVLICDSSDEFIQHLDAWCEQQPHKAVATRRAAQNAILADESFAMKNDYAKYVKALEEQQRRNRYGKTVWTEPTSKAPNPSPNVVTVKTVETIGTLELSERLEALKVKARKAGSDPKAQAVLSITGLVLGADQQVVGTVPSGVAPWLVNLLNQRKAPAGDQT